MTNLNIYVPTNTKTKVFCVVALANETEAES